MFDRAGTVLAFAVVVVALVAASGLGVDPVLSPSEPEHDPTELVSEMTTTDPPSIEGTLHSVVERNGTELRRSTFEVVERPPSDERQVTITDSEDTRFTIVDTPTTLLTYNEDTHELTEMDPDEDGIIVPALEFDHYSDVVDEFEVRYVGTDRVADRDAHVVVFTADGETDASLTLLVGGSEYQLAEASVGDRLGLDEHRLWIDVEHAHPLMEQSTLVGPDGQEVTVTDRYEHIRFDTVTDAIEFDVPADAWTSEPTKTAAYDSIEEAAATVSISPPEPEIPDGYEFENALVWTTEDEERLTLRYTDGDDFLSVASLPPSEPPSTGASIDIDGNDGYLYESLTGAAVRLECSDRVYRITGTPAAEVQLSVAESLTCS